MADQALPFQTVLDAFSEAKGSHFDQFGQMDLPTFSRFMNQSLGTDRYRIGEKASGLTGAALYANAGLSDLLESVSKTTGEIGGNIGSLFGDTGREVGQSVGASLPRTAADLGMLAGGTALNAIAPGTGLPLYATALGSAGTQTYANTGSVPAALISAGSLAAMPLAGKLGEGAATRLLTPQIERFIGKSAPFVSEGIPREAGSIAGIIANQEAARQGESLVQGQGFQPVTPRSIGEEVAGYLPFLPGHVPRLAKGFRVDYKPTEKGNSPVVASAGWQDLFRNNRGPYFQRQSEAEALVKSGTVSETDPAIKTFAETSRKVQEVKETVATKKKSVSLDDEDALAAESLAQGLPPIPNVGVQPPLPGLVEGKAMARTKLVTVDRATAYALRDKRPNSTVKFNDKTKNWEVEWDVPPLPKPAFLPEQLISGTYGLVAREQLNEAKPFGVPRLPGDFLPGNEVMKNMAKVLSPGEWKILQDQGIEQFLRGNRVHIRDLDQWIEQNGPRVEVRKAGETQLSANETEYNDLSHYWYDALNGAQRAILDENWIKYKDDPASFEGVLLANRFDPESAAKGRRYLELGNVLRRGSGDLSLESSTNTHWQSIAPKPESDMSGYVELAVTVPRKRTMATFGKTPEQQDVERGIQFPSSHNFPPNTLVFVRGYMETLKDGTKAFHVIEVQSDWAKKQKQVEDRNRERPAETPEGQQMQKFASDQIANPLLSDYNRLGLKTAIDHAIREGAQKIVISDAETAMMTEGHDQRSTQQLVDAHGNPIIQGPNPPAGAKWTTVIEQEKGMRQAYDKTLPDITSSLTGAKGEKVEMGEHKNAINVDQNSVGSEGIGSPVFKNPDGTPKANVTGLSFDLAKVKAELLRRGGFTLFGRDKLIDTAKTLEKDGSSTESVARSMQELANRPIRPGESIADIAAREVGLSEIINQQNDPANYLLGVHQFFDRYFTLKGETGPRKDFLIRNAMVMAAKFENVAGRTRLAEVLQGPSLHAPAREGKFNALIGLRTTKVLQSRELENFRILWDFGHEIAHEIEAQITADPLLSQSSPLHQAYQAAFESSKTLDPVEKDLAMKGLVRQALPNSQGEYDYKGQVYRQFKGAEPEAEASEFVADFLGLLGLSASNTEAKNTMADYLFLTNTETQNLSGSFMKDLTGSIVGAKDFMSQQIALVGKEARTEAMLRSMDEIHSNLVRVLEGARRAEVANDAFRGVYERAMVTAYDAPPIVSYKQISQMFRMLGTPGLWVKRAETPETYAALDQAEEETMPKAGGKRLKWYERLFPATQLGQSYPEMKPVIDMVRDVIARVSRSTESMWGHFADPTGKVDSNRLKELGVTGKMRSAFDELRLFQNVEEKLLTGNELKSFLRERGHDLTNEQISRIDLSNQQFGGVHQEAAQLLIRANEETLRSKTTVVLQAHNRALRPNEAARAAEQIVDFVLHPPTGILPEQIALVEAQLKLATGSESGYTNAIAVASAGRVGHVNLTEKLSDRPWFSSEVRPHTWMVAFKDESGVRHLESFKTQPELQKRFENLSTKSLPYLKAFNKLDTSERWRGLQRDVIEAYKDADQRVYDATIQALQGVGDPRTLEMMAEEFKPGDGAYRLVTPPYMLERSLVMGRENLNMTEQALNYVDAVAYGTAKRWAKQQLQVLLNSPELRENAALQNVLREYVSTFLDPQGKEFTLLKNFIFLNFMGFNLSTNLCELTQNFLSTIPVMIRSGATIGQAYKYMTAAMGEVGKAHLDGKSFKTPKFADDEIRDVIDRLEHDRVIDKGVIQELYSLEDALTVSRRNILTGDGKVASAKQLAANSAYQVTKMARDFYGLSTTFNSRAAGVAAYRYAREVKRMSHDDAYSYAKDMINVGLYGGGRANRPTVLNGLGKAQGIGGVMYALSGYTFNTLAMYARFAKESYHGDKAAQKALGTMLSSQAMVGGLMGLPIVSGLIAVLEQLFPDVEIKKNLRSAFTKLGGDDEQMGHILADVGMSGMFNAALPVADVGSRFQLGNLLGVDPYHGFQYGNLGGPATGMLENIVKGTQKAAQGDYWNAAEKVAPAGLRGLIRMLGEGGGFRDEKGKLIIDPTPAEQVVTALGFRPKRLNQYYEQQQLTKRSEEIELRRRDGLYQELARDLLVGNVQKVKADLIEETRRTREAGGLFDPKEGLARVVELAQSYKTPVDPARNGLKSNVEERTRIAGMYPQPTPPSELRQYLERKAMERQIGIPGAGRLDVGAVREAQMVDTIMQQVPGLTYVKARLMVQKAFSRSQGNPPVPVSQQLSGFSR